MGQAKIKESGGGKTRRQGPRQPGAENTQCRRHWPRTEWKKKATTTNRATTARRGPSKQREHQNGPQQRVRRTKARPGNQPARPGQEEHAQAQPGVASSDLKEMVSASTQTSPGAPVESPVERWMVREPGPVSDRVHTGKPPQCTQPKTDTGGTRQGQLHRGAPTGYNAGRAQRPASAGASSRHHEPGSRPASTCATQPPIKSGGESPQGGKRHHIVGKAGPEHRERPDQKSRDAPRGATRDTREARRRPQPMHTDRCQATTATRCRKPGQRAQHATRHGTGTGARQHQTHTTQTPARNGGVEVECAHRHTLPDTRARNGGAQPISEPKNKHPHHTTRQGWTGYRRSAHTEAHNPTPGPEIAGRSRNQSPNTHTNTAKPGQYWQGNCGASTQTHTPQHPSQG